MALSGTLKDFGIADIFQLIGQQQKTGVLHLSERDDEVHVAFKDGNIVRAECATGRRRSCWATCWCAGAHHRAAAAGGARRAEAHAQALGDILVARGSVDRNALRDMAQLQTCETIYRLFA